MRIEQLNSLTEDELAVLWMCINKINPSMCGVELEPSLFPAIKHRALMDRLTNCKQFIKTEHHEFFDGLVNKLRV